MYTIITEFLFFFEDIFFKVSVALLKLARLNNIANRISILFLVVNFIFYCSCNNLINQSTIDCMSIYFARSQLPKRSMPCSIISCFSGRPGGFTHIALFKFQCLMHASIGRNNCQCLMLPIIGCINNHAAIRRKTR